MKFTVPLVIKFRTELNGQTFLGAKAPAQTF